VRLLLDEMFSPEIARQLRLRGHDVVAVLEQLELVRLLDPDVFEAAQTEQRTVVTENALIFCASTHGIDGKHMITTA
jgi:hypothetical protein